MYKKGIGNALSMTMPKGWKSTDRNIESLKGLQSSDDHKIQSSGEPEHIPHYRNPIPPGYMPTSPPSSRVAWPSRTTSLKEDHESSGGSVIDVVIIFAVIVILIAAISIGPYALIMIPIIIIGLLRGLKRGSGTNQYHDNMSRGGHRGK